MKAYHQTNEKNIPSIMERGLLINQDNCMTEGGYWSFDYYGCRPLFVSFDREFIYPEDYIGESEDDKLVSLEVDITGMELLPDLPSLIDEGGIIDSHNHVIWWKEGEEPESLLGYINDDGEINIHDLLIPNSEVGMAVMSLTKTAIIKENITVDKIKVVEPIIHKLRMTNKFVI